MAVAAEGESPDMAEKDSSLGVTSSVSLSHPEEGESLDLAEKDSSLDVTSSVCLSRPEATEEESPDMAEKDSSMDLSSSVCLSHPVGVTRSETQPRSFVDAAWDKFNGEMAVDDCIGIYMPKKGPAKITDSGHLILPWRVHMTDCGITEAGQHADMAAMCHNVTELDLAHNNITSLEEVIQVISCMPQLTFLNLTCNPLHPSSISLAAHSVWAPVHPPTTTTTTTPTTPVIAHPATFTGITGSSEASTPSDDASPSDPSVGGGGTDEDLSPGSHGFQEGMEMGTTPPDIRTEKKLSDNQNANVKTPPTTIIPIPTTTTTTATATVDITSSSPGLNNNTISGTTPSSQASSGSPKTECGSAPADHPPGASPSSPPVAAFSTLRQLVLNDTGVEWVGIVGLLRLFPSLEEVHLSLNHYKTVEIPTDFVYPSLARLFFNNSDVTSWAHICRLGHLFPRLRQLFLAETRITSLAVREGEDGKEEKGEREGKGGMGGCRRTEELFPCLELLSLNKTQLRGWEEVDRLREFPSLFDVRLQGIPFLEAQDNALRRQQLVARLPNITRLNGSSVTAEERLDAERAFIRLFLDHDCPPQRYKELVEVHGQLDPLVKVSLAPKTLFNVVVVMGDRREPYEVSTSQTVRELKKSLQNIAGMPANKFNLFYLDKGSAFGADKLKYPDKKLYTYNIADGDEFIIQPKD
ncbi:uncharacterized protein LOC143291636 [Babylonia areolata]|uniref:uncharacterized protein LOC143291636 n=1 Tax=Babylonia areolata TaxID=304850 RepID=UPI003FD48008